MRDYNYSNPNPVPSNKKVDTISIIIALIAVTLIVAGTYLLIQALKPSEKTVVSNVRSSVSVSSLRSQINIISSNSVSSAVSSAAQESSTVVSSTPVSSAASSVVSSQASSTVSSVASSQAVSSTAAPTTGVLQTGSTNAEALFRVDKVSGGLAKLTVLKTGFTNTRWLQPGSYINLESGLLPNATIGSNYIIPLTIGANQTNFAIQSVGTPVKQ